MPSQQALELFKKLMVQEEMQEEILSRAGSGYGREQLVRYALALACAELRGPGVPANDLVLDYLREAETHLKGEADA